MNTVFRLIIELEGIIGAIMGVIATLVTTEIISNKGGIKYYPKVFDYTMYKSSDLGDQIETTSYDDAEWSLISIELDIFNSSDSPKALRDILIKLYDSEWVLLLETKVHDESTRRYSSGMSRTEIIEILNMGPREMTHLKVSSSLDKEETKLIRNYKTIFIEAEDYKGKMHKHLLWTKM